MLSDEQIDLIVSGMEKGYEDAGIPTSPEMRDVMRNTFVMITVLMEAQLASEGDIPDMGSLAVANGGTTIEEAQYRAVMEGSIMAVNGLLGYDFFSIKEHPENRPPVDGLDPFLIEPDKE